MFHLNFFDNAIHFHCHVLPILQPIFLFPWGIERVTPRLLINYLSYLINL